MPGLRDTEGMHRSVRTVGRTLRLALGATLVLGVAWSAVRAEGPTRPRYADQKEADAKNPGCLSCHTATDSKSMHTAEVALSCLDCHGGHGDVMKAGEPGSKTYLDAQHQAHVNPANTAIWKGAANPQRSYTALLAEDLAFVRFINPGDLRAAPSACGPCHEKARDPIVTQVSKGLMTHAAMLYGAALYNNGVLPLKNGIVGESYDPVTGAPRRVNTVPAPTPEETLEKGWLPFLLPFPRWELGQTGNPFRVFERGSRRRFEIGLPSVEEDPGKPDKGLSPRGPGTLNRTDPLILGAQKTRLVDPMLSLLGTNDHPGDYRSSGCTACHVIYANDRSRSNSGPYASAGNRGATASADGTIPRGESGHPLKHQMTLSIPSSQCMTCHMHPGTNMVATYLGYTWWDNEADAKDMYDPRPHSPAERAAIENSNPEGAALRGKWSDPAFLADLSQKMNGSAEHTQFGDFHGHGWVFRGVYKKDRKGNLLDPAGALVTATGADKFQKDGDAPAAGKAVHLKDIHLEKGMHCVDCHFKQDNHGNGKLYSEPRPAVEIDCADCHGNENAAATLVTSGPAASGKLDLTELSTPFEGKPRFRREGGRIIQHSMLEKDLEWTVPQAKDTDSPGGKNAHRKHSSDKLTCYACHSAWTTSCFGCHLSMRANEKRPNLHSEGGESRNWTSYNFQTLRDDIYFLAKDGYVGPNHKNEEGKPVRNRVAPARSACAILVSSQNQNREWIYSQQQTVSGAGFSGTAFSTYVPHTVRKTETKTCTDCHVSKDNDNNAWMASLVMQGTGLMNFIGRYAYVGEESHGFEAVVVTERDEPQAVIGSRLHELAYPKEAAAHAAAGRQLKEAYHHGGNVLSLQLRGEYLFAAQGKDGLRIYDVAQVDQKGFSERIVSAPVSPLGQKLYVKTKNATSVALPTTMTIDPPRREGQNPAIVAANMEQPVHPLYDYAFVTDKEEGIVVVGPLNTLLDGDPRNNFVKRASAYLGPEGELKDASSMAIAGTIAYVTTPRGVVAVDLYDGVAEGTTPKTSEAPRLKVLKTVPLSEPVAVAVQFRYAFVVDAQGLTVLDATDPRDPKPVDGARVEFAHGHSLYLARTYAYVAAGEKGVAIVDIEHADKPKLDQWMNGEGHISDAHDVKIGFTNGSGFAYVADGKNGLHVIQIISANDTPGAYGFSPRPTPKWVATYRTHGPAVALSRGLDRDRAVDETGNQLAVFGRRGARPFNRAELDMLRTMKPQVDPAKPPAGTASR